MRRSFWLEHIDNELTPNRSLTEDMDTDIAIIGGGYVGLWTALQIRKKSPKARIVILEQDICGGGASGRNGGFIMSWWPKISSLLNLSDKKHAVKLAEASVNAITEIKQFCLQHQIDAHFQQNGWIWGATTRAQLEAWNGVMQLCSELGHTIFLPLNKDENQARTGSPIHLSGVFDKTVATVQPAKLVRGLYRVALSQNIQIYENTKVSHFSRGDTVQLQTRNGIVNANQMVIATNAWAARIPELNKMIVPVTSTLLITEPIPEKLKQIGWIGGEAITDSQLLVNYYRTTKDGRIAFGKGTGSLEFCNRISPRFDYNTNDAKATEQDFRRSFPMLDDVKITHTWCGAIDRSYDSLPTLGTLSGTDNIHYGIGWSGNGVGPSLIGGKILSSLVLGLRDEWSHCVLVNRSVKKFPPEPFRFIGGSLVRQAVIRKEAAEAKETSPGFVDAQLSKLAPSGLEDK